MIDPTSPKSQGYHLFLEPAGQLAEQLSAVIKDLATQYESTAFVPHVTLLARIPGDEADIVKKAKALAATYAPFTLTLSELGTEEAFFKALYMHIPEREIMKKHHKAALAAFGMEDESPFMPHLSLLYGCYDKEVKKKTMHVLNVPVGASFKVEKLALYKTAGAVKGWKKVGEFEFKG